MSQQSTQQAPLPASSVCPALSSLAPNLTSSASRLFWVRVPRLSHWSQMAWQRLFTEAASW